MPNSKWVARGFWLAALLFALTGALIMVKNKGSGAVFLALAAFWMVLAIAQRDKPGP